MKRTTPNDKKITVILDLIAALDGRILKAEHDQGLLYIIADISGDEHDATRNCPFYEPCKADEVEHCIHCCPECGHCMLNMDGEDC